MVEPGAGGGGARRPMDIRYPTPARVSAFAEVGRGLNLAREKLTQQMNRKVLGVVVGDVAIGAAGGAAARIALDMALGIAGGPLGGAAAGAIKGSFGEWLKQSREIADSGDRLSFKENLKRHNGGRIAVAAARGAIIGAAGGALGEYAIEQISQTEWGQQAGKFISDRAGEFVRTISKQPFFKIAPSSAPGLLEPGQIPSPPAIPDAIEPLPAVPVPAELPPVEIPLTAAPDIEPGQLPPAPAVPVEIPPAAPPIVPAPEIGTPLPPSPAAPGEVLLPPPGVPDVAEPAVAESPAAIPAPEIQTDQVTDQVEPLPPEIPTATTPAPTPIPSPPPAIIAEPPPSVTAPPEFKPPDIQTDQVADQVEPLPPTVAPNGAQVQGSVVDNSLTYNGKPWVLLENGTRNIGHLLQSVGEEGSTINEQVMAAKLQEAAVLWTHGQLTSSNYPDLHSLLHLCNGTEEVYNGLLNENTLVSLRNLGIIS